MVVAYKWLNGTTEVVEAHSRHSATHWFVFTGQFIVKSVQCSRKLCDCDT